MSETSMDVTQSTDHATVPKLYYDGGHIDVLWDNHEQAASWYQTFLGWNKGKTEDWKMDYRAYAGKFTSMGWGTWLNSMLSNLKLPHHVSDRGTVDPNVRWCWRIRDLEATHTRLKEDGIRVSDIYPGPGGHDYFDFWTTAEGTRLTAQADTNMTSDTFDPSWTRIGVRDLQKAVAWYREFVGMDVLEEHYDQCYVVMGLWLNHHENERSTWVLEQLPDETYTGKVDGPLRPYCVIHDRDDFFKYQQYLTASGVEASEIGGFPGGGIVFFHFYDPDGNRFNVNHY